jgi:hypothetical protein
MLSWQDAIAVIDRLHEAQACLYHGPDEVIEYMLARRRLADGTFRMHRLDVLTGESETVAVLTDGEASIRGAHRRWSTVGLHRLEGSRVAECRLLPQDQAEFDDIWTPRQPG